VGGGVWGWGCVGGGVGGGGGWGGGVGGVGGGGVGGGVVGVVGGKTLKYLASIYLDGLGKATKDPPISVVRVLADIAPWHLHQIHVIIIIDWADLQVMMYELCVSHRVSSYS